MVLGLLGWAYGREEKLVLNQPLSQIFPLDSKTYGMFLAEINSSATTSASVVQCEGRRAIRTVRR